MRTGCSQFLYRITLVVPAIFAPFAHLTTLEVVALEDGFLDLSTLQLSNSLQTLVMQGGVFKTESLPPKLANLSLADCDVESYQDCSCVTSLARLKLLNSRLRGLHHQGLLACHALEGLTCLQSYVFAMDVNLDILFGLDFLQCLLACQH
ncbi:TPA: hypothetical protein ACH3X1_011541 [Trebouxia sp. C0004]